jgi:hypothetical protein
MCDPVDLGIDDFVEAQEITDEWQVIAVAHPIRLCECASARWQD